MFDVKLLDVFPRLTERLVGELTDALAAGGRAGSPLPGLYL